MKSARQKSEAATAIIGAGGRVGGAAVRSLRAVGMPVNAIVHSSSANQYLAEPRAEVKNVDICKARQLAEAVADCRRILVMCPTRPQ